MAASEYKRKLVTILHADVKGYSRLIGEDEDAIVDVLTVYRKLMGGFIQEHRGRVVHGSGDSLLAEFVSVIDAVRCGVEIQKELKSRNSELPENRRVEFRIGINLGDVIEKDEDLHGDGVNIAARIESLAEGGGICMSRTAFDQVRGKLDLGYEYIGEHSVKNIKQPVRVYKILMDTKDARKIIGEKPKLFIKNWIWTTVVLGVIIFTLIGYQFLQKVTVPDSEPASTEKMAFPIPEKPSIAVLPFNNLSEDPEQEYFSDGMTDDIITDLSKISGLMVISSSSTFTYKGKEIKMPVIAKELGVKYVLEGSVRRSGDEIRINAQLIDAVTDHHVWADRFDGKNKSVFDLQDKITARIVSALALKLSPPEQKVMAEKGTSNLVAYDTFLRGMGHLRIFTPKDYVKAIEYFEKAIELDPDYSEAYASLALTYINALAGGKRFWDEIGKSYPHCRVLARQNVETAMKKRPTSMAYQVLAKMELFRRNFDEAIDYAEHALAIAPNDADALETLGYIMSYAANPVKAINYYKRAIMIDPLKKSTGGIGNAYFELGDYEKATEYIENHIKDYPEIYGLRAPLAAAYAFLGNDTKAKKAFEEFNT